MGVTGLWKLIDDSGKPVPLETLENKVLAIDISIWLHQVVKGFQDNKGSAIAHAHLLGLFNRLCKLLYYRIKPVFVFDGGVPYLKRQTIAKRSQGRNKLINEAERLQQLLLESLAKEKVVKQALGVNAELLLKSPPKPKPAKKSREEDLFKLPELPSSQDVINSSQSSTGDDATSDTDSSFEGNSLRHSYLQNLHSIDVTSSYFKNLPADVRHEILTDIKEIRKQSSWGRLHELPAQSDDFSLFQMKRLLKRRQVQVSLEEAEKQMEGKSLTLNELQTFLTEEGVVNTAKANATKQIASDENTRFLLVRDLKKAIEKAAKKEEENPAEDGESSEEKCVKMEKLGKEYDEELETAIKMSLEATAVYDDDDYDCDNVKMSKEQREKLRSAATSLARAYMIEYGGMNDDEVKELFSTTQNAEEDDDITDSFCFNHNDKFIVQGDMCTPYKHIEDKLLKQNDKPVNEEVKDKVLVENKQMGETKTDPEEIGIISSDSDSDSDFIEVKEVVNDMKINNKKESEQKLEIFVDLTQLDKDEEDIFADVFDSDSNKAIILSDASASAVEIGRKMSTQERAIEGEKADRKEESDEDILKESLVVEEDELEKEDSVSMGDKIVEDSSAGDGEKNIIDGDKMKVDEKDVKSSSKALSSNLKDILNKLKEKLNEIPKISLDDIVLDNFDAKEQETKNAAVSQSKQDKGDIKMHKILEEGDIKAKATEQSKQIQEDNLEAMVIRKDDIKASTVKAHDILNKLKQDLESVSKITLDDIKLNSSDDVKKAQETSTEVIEIVEDNDLLDTAKTPSKAKIGNYFETQFVVKRTPEKSVEDEKETTPKVQSPFFVNKSPSSSTKKRNQLLSGEDEPPEKRDKTVSKMLFEKPTEDESTQELGVNPIDSSETALEIAGKILQENKSREELEDLADVLARERRDLEAERNKQNRMGASITDKMSTDCMHLLQLFGVPYIIAPMEAEAQCAFLDASNLTDGTITDDSDIWLFGGQTVYKNFFNQKKHVMEYRIENIEKLYSMDRKKLIQLAILVGSDYTTGINGVGAVTALEILATFPTTAPKDGEVTNTMSVLSSLRRFREWFRNGAKIGVGGKTALRSKLKNIEMVENFPNLAVVEAYLSPKVDDSRDKFKWGTPDAETIREFTKKTFGWTRMKTDEILLPVLKRMNEKKVQASIKNYFAVKSSTSFHQLKVSKRVQKAINKISGVAEDEDEPKVKKKRSKLITKNNPDAEKNDGIKQKPKVKRTRKAQKSVTDAGEPSTSSSWIDKELEDIPNKISKKNVNIPNTKQVIPQKEKDLKEMQKKKELAAELFKKSQGNEKQKKKG